MTEFIGRATAVDQLAQEMRRVNDGRFRCVVIRGEAGAGKSMLVQHALQRNDSEPDGLIAAVGQCTASGRPFAPFRQALESLVPKAGSTPSVRRARIARLLLRGVKELAPDVAGVLLPGSSLVLASARLLAEEAGWFERLGDRLNARSEQSSIDSIGDIDIQASALIRSLSAKEPLALVVEDSHWIDEASLGLMNRLVAEAHESKLLVILTYRTSDIDMDYGASRHPFNSLLRELGRRFGDIVIDLDFVAHQEARAFCEELTSPYVGANGLADHLVEITNGLPLFAIEYLRLLKDGRSLKFDWDSGEWQFHPRENASSKLTSVRSVIRERLDRLDDELLDLLEHCSIDGPLFDAQHIAALMDRHPLDVIKTLSRVLDRRHHLVVDVTSDVADEPRRLYRFYNDLIHDQIYKALPGNYRRELHSRLADVLSAECSETTILISIAKHRERAGEVVASTEAYVSAARAMYEQANVLESFELIEHAECLSLRCTLPVTVEARLAVVAGMIASARRFWKRAYECYQKAFELSESLDDDLWAETQLGLGVSLWRTKEPTGARIAFHRLLSSPRSTSAQHARIEATRHLAILQKDTGDYEGALALYEEVREAAAAANLPATAAQVYNNMGFLRGAVLGDYGTSIRHYEDAAAVALEHGLLRERILFLRNLHTYAWLGDHETAEMRTNEAVFLANELGNPNDQMRCRINRARVYLARGKFQLAQKELTAIRTSFADDYENDATSHLDVLCLLALAELNLGHHQDCRRWAEAAIRFSEQHLTAVEQDVGTQEVGTPWACLALVAAQEASEGIGDLDSMSCHVLFIDELKRLGDYRRTAKRPKWTVPYNEVLAGCGAAATASGDEDAGHHVDLALTRMRGAVQLPGGAQVLLRLLDKIAGPHRDTIAPVLTMVTSTANATPGPKVNEVN